MIETIAGKSTVTGTKIVEDNELKWVFIFPVGTEIKCANDEAGGNISFIAPNCSPCHLNVGAGNDRIIIAKTI